METLEAYTKTIYFPSFFLFGCIVKYLHVGAPKSFNQFGLLWIIIQLTSCYSLYQWILAHVKCQKREAFALGFSFYYHGTLHLIY